MQLETGSQATAHVLALKVPRGSLPLSRTDWGAMVAQLGAWPEGSPFSPLLGRRLSRSGQHGALTETLVIGIRDPLGRLSSLDARRELLECARPLRSVRALPLLRAPAAALRSVCASHVSSLGGLDGVIPEGLSAAAPLFDQLVEGLTDTPGAVGMVMLLSPVSAELAGPALLPDASSSAIETGDEAFSDDAVSEALDAHRAAPRELSFSLTLWGDAPIPHALLARAAALCTFRRPTNHDWIEAAAAEELAVANAAINGFAHLHSSTGTPPGAAAFVFSLQRSPARGKRTVDGRAWDDKLPAAGPIIGLVARPSGGRASWRLSWPVRTHHVFVSGASGSGKSTTFVRMILDDIEHGRTVVLIDPHGDTARDLTDVVPAERLRFVDPRADDSAPLDLLDADPARAAAHLLSATTEVWPAEFSGPAFQRCVSLAARGLSASTATPGRFTLVDLERFVTDPDWRRTVIDKVDEVDETKLRAELEFEHRAWKRENTGSDTTMVNWVSSKLTPLVSGPARCLFESTPERSLEDDVSAGSVLLITLPIGLLGDATTRLTARMFLTRLTAAIAHQGAVPEEDRHPIAVFLDEAHLMFGQALRGLFAQARKFNCSATLACQAPSQLEPGLDEILTNCQTHLLGRLSAREAMRLADRIGPAGVEVLPSLPRHHMVLALEDNDPGLTPLVLTPSPVPEVRRSPSVRARHCGAD